MKDDGRPLRNQDYEARAAQRADEGLHRAYRMNCCKLRSHKPYAQCH